MLFINSTSFLSYLLVFTLVLPKHLDQWLLMKGLLVDQVNATAMFLQSIEVTKCLGGSFKREIGCSEHKSEENSDRAIILCMMMMAVEEGLLEWKSW